MVTEAGQNLEVCVVLDGRLERNVTLTLESADDSAVGT